MRLNLRTHSMRRNGQPSGMQPEPPAPIRRVLYDDLTGTAGSLVVDRSGWVALSKSNYLATGRSKAVIAAGGAGFTWLSGWIPDYFAFGYNTLVASHSCTVQIDSGFSSYFLLAAAPNITVDTVLPNGIGVKVLSKDQIKVFSRNAYTEVSTLLNNNTITGQFPLNEGDFIKAVWDDTTSKLTLYKNGIWLWTSAVMSLVVRGSWVCFGYDYAPSGCSQIQIEDNQIGRTVTLTGSTKVRQRKTTGGCDVTLTGKYTGLIPYGVQYQAWSGNTIIVDWADASAYTATGGVWSAKTVSLPDGGPYRVRVRGKSRPTELDIGGWSNLFYVGDVYAVYGQCSTAYLANNSTTTYPFSPAANALVWRKSSESVSNIGLQALANRLKAAKSYPVMVVAGGLDGSPASSIKPGTSAWTTHYNTIISACGNDGIAGSIFLQGGADLSLGTSTADYVNHCNDIRSAYLTLGSRSLTDNKWGFCTIGRDQSRTNGIADDSWQTMRISTSQTIVSGGEGRFIAGHAVTLPQTDIWNLNGDGSVMLAESIAQSILKAEGLASHNGLGPIPTVATLASDGLSVTVTMNMNGCTSLSDHSAELTGWRVFKAGVVVTVSSARVSGDTVILLLSSAQTGPLRVCHMHNVNPVRTNPVSATAGWASGPVAAAPVDLTTIPQRNSEFV